MQVPRQVAQVSRRGLFWRVVVKGADCPNVKGGGNVGNGVRLGGQARLVREGRWDATCGSIQVCMQSDSLLLFLRNETEQKCLQHFD